jgi:hypothetical protein
MKLIIKVLVSVSTQFHRERLLDCGESSEVLTNSDSLNTAVQRTKPLKWVCFESDRYENMTGWQVEAGRGPGLPQIHAHLLGSWVEKSC